MCRTAPPATAVMTVVPSIAAPTGAFTAAETQTVFLMN